MNQTPAAHLGPELGMSDIMMALWRRKWMIVIILAVSIGTAYFVTKRIRSRYKATAQMIVIQRSSSIANSVDASYSAPLLESPDTQVEMINSSSMAIRTFNWLRNEAFNKRTTIEQLGITDVAEVQRDFASLISVQVPKETNVLTLNATAYTADQAAALANAVCQAFVEWKKEIARASVQDKLTSLEGRARRANEQMLQAEQEETRFKQTQKLVDVPTQMKAQLEQYLQRDAEVAGLKRDLGSQEERARTLEGQLKTIEGAIRSGTGIRDDGQVQELQRQLNALEIEKANAELKYTPEYPGVLPDLNAKIKDVQERLTNAIQGTLDNKRPSLNAQEGLRQSYNQAMVEIAFTRAKLNAAAAMRDQSQRPLGGLPEMSMQYARIARKAEMARQLFSSLQTELNMARLNKDSVDGNVRITSMAQPPDAPFYPDRTRNLIMGGVLGLALAIPLALLLESNHGRTRNVGEIRQLSKAPVIGVLPKMSRAQVREVEAGTPPPMIKEIFNMARANMGMIARKDTKHDPWHNRTVMITSAVPGEGKSMAAANFARTLARSGKIVVLIDADMRRPRQSQLFPYEADFGLVDVLQGTMSPADALASSDQPNLYILHSGITSRNPTELISLPVMGEVLQAYREAADVVIVDTPACVAVADALYIAPHVDSIIQVVGVGKVETELVRETTDKLRMAGNADFALLINHAQREARHSYGKYYARRIPEETTDEDEIVMDEKRLQVPMLPRDAGESEEKTQ